jgi:hypothetical protein
MTPPEPKLEEMLANPEFLPAPLFSRDRYLAQVGHGMMAQFLRATDQPPEVFQQMQPAHADANSSCLKVIVVARGKKILVVGWTFDLDLRGPEGQLGRDLWLERAKPPEGPVVNLSTDSFAEEVFARRVLRVQVEADPQVKQPPGAMIVPIKNLGWYVAGLVPPARKPGAG